MSVTRFQAEVLASLRRVPGPGWRFEWQVHRALDCSGDPAGNCTLHYALVALHRKGKVERNTTDAQLRREKRDHHTADPDGRWRART